MKILQVIPFFVPAWGFGGPVRVCFDISRKLIGQGHAVTVLTTDAYDQEHRIKKHRESINGISIIRFPNISNKIAKGFNLYLPLGFKKYFAKHVREYDIVHLHAFFTYQNVVASMICRKYKIPYILHLHESPLPKRILGKVLIKKVFNSLYGKKIINGASCIFALTSAEKEDLISHYPNLKNRVEIIPNGIEIKKTDEIDKRNLREKYRFDPDAKIFLSVSRLARIKRIDLLIRAFAELQKKEEGSMLLIVGPDEGDNQKKLLGLCNTLNIAKNVVFAGTVDGNEKDDIYNLSDVYVLMSDYESFSLTCLEALQHNLPLCLSKNIGVAHDVLQLGCGILATAPENAKETASKLQISYNKRKALSKNCRSALNQFEIDNIVRKIINIYSRITCKETTL